MNHYLFSTVFLTHCAPYEVQARTPTAYLVSRFMWLSHLVVLPGLIRIYSIVNRQRLVPNILSALFVTLNTYRIRTIQINAASRQEQRARYVSGVASVLQKLLLALNERTEWGQVFILDTLACCTLPTPVKPKAPSIVTAPPACSTPTLPLSRPPSKPP
jgi:hypothetical protein